MVINNNKKRTEYGANIKKNWFLVVGCMDKMGVKTSFKGLPIVLGNGKNIFNCIDSLEQLLLKGKKSFDKNDESTFKTILKHFTQNF